MSITVSMSDLLRRATGEREPIRMPAGSPLECLRKLIVQVPSARKWLYDDQGKLKPHVWLMVNDERIYEDELANSLNDGDNLFIMIAVLGG